MRSDTDNRDAKDILLLRTETESPGDFVFPRRRSACVLQMAVHWVCRGDIRVLEPVWVRLKTTLLLRVLPLELINYALCSDFFPVILTFLRQLPFIGTFLTLPYIRDVRGKVLRASG